MASNDQGCAALTPLRACKDCQFKTHLEGTDFLLCTLPPDCAPPPATQEASDKCADWFAPTNRHSDDYHMAMGLHAIGLLDCRRSCRHRDSQFRGYCVEFRVAAAFTTTTLPSESEDQAA